jgi:hypothetical protein
MYPMIRERRTRFLGLAIRAIAVVLPATVMVGPTRADPAVRIGARGGVELRDHADRYAGVDLRLAFPMTPLTINPTFDYVFDPAETLYEVSVNALYFLPVPTTPLDPYLGIGVNLTIFKLNTPGTTGQDDNGNRLGMNLTAGICVDVPFVSPFAQVTKQLGEFHPLSLGGGLVIALDGDARWTGCGRRAR